jgi:hypothetical protein
MAGVKYTNCCFCNIQIKDIDSNNAQPLADDRCCGDCNASKVVPARIKAIYENEKSN